VRYGDRVRVGVTVERLGKTSVTVLYHGSVEGHPVFRARNTMVVVEMKDFRPVPIPGWLRERLISACDPEAPPGP